MFVCLVLGEVGATSTGYRSIPKIKIGFFDIIDPAEAGTPRALGIFKKKKLFFSSTRALDR